MGAVHVAWPVTPDHQGVGGYNRQHFLINLPGLWPLATDKVKIA